MKIPLRNSWKQTERFAGTLECELCVSDSLGDSRGADEESELGSVLIHLVV